MFEIEFRCVLYLKCLYSAHHFRMSPECHRIIRFWNVLLNQKNVLLNQSALRRRRSLNLDFWIKHAAPQVNLFESIRLKIKQWRALNLDFWIKWCAAPQVNLFESIRLKIKQCAHSIWIFELNALRRRWIFLNQLVFWIALFLARNQLCSHSIWISN